MLLPTESPDHFGWRRVAAGHHRRDRVEIFREGPRDWKAYEMPYPTTDRNTDEPIATGVTLVDCRIGADEWLSDFYFGRRVTPAGTAQVQEFWSSFLCP